MSNIQDGYDICVLKGSKWVLFNSYTILEKELAMQDAIELKQTKAFRGVCVIRETKREVIYFHHPHKTKGSFKEVEESLRSDDPMIRSEQQTTQPLFQRKKEPPKTEKKEDPKIEDVIAPELRERKKKERLATFYGVTIGVSGIAFAMFIASAMHQNHSDPGLTAISFLLLSTLSISAGMFISHQKIQDDKSIPSLELNESSLNDPLKEIEKTVTEGRDAYWSESEGKMEGDTHFALLLYMSGFLKHLAQNRHIQESSISEARDIIFQSLGINLSAAEPFFKNLSEYLAYPRYRIIYNMGEEGAEHVVRKESSRVKEALSTWQNMQTPQSNKSEVSAILFTDIVSFTENSQTQGDKWVLDVVKAHNQIVRDILASYEGKEIKHTGDGIMASFHSTEQAIQASIAMQKGFEYFRSSMPSRAFEVRIGVSAGEPLHMGNDLFGTPVNLAARVMQYADGNDIVIHESAYLLSKDTATFSAIPDCELKGFKEPQTLYKVLWSPEQQAKPAM